ncbi:gamma-glutamyl-gamma-aminobutyrate hydrolase family protein [Miniphocaeibacter massiliensis]|uniref:gamma-glutamyl-gamma-aminobutyrate hydrolase family protein n=1 Tax=Miniphocaeibacter massiliensis TaxID=2041841 RepID=UPI000C1B81B1|nr:gamma-glutamyl-gamma-aminobutyrate hydrolase family protein [Miniphocaeibacter massiliensis]
MDKFIGIPCWLENREGFISHEINNNFSKMILESGGIPIVIPQIYDENLLDEYINMIEGLILVGGSDISPYLYNEGPNRYLESTSPVRDEVEFYLLKKAIGKKIPVFGVCRGMQLINIFFGGTLYQDMYSQCEDVFNHSDREKKGIIYYHKININEGSRLHSIYGSDIVVNTFHHQSVKKIAKNFKITAKSDDGIIEAIEYEKDQFIMGIQFHPEFPEHNGDFYKIFEYFISHI